MHKERIRERLAELPGKSFGSGNSSSKYSQIAILSQTTVPLCNNVGTKPVGLSAKYSLVRLK